MRSDQIDPFPYAPENQYRGDGVGVICTHYRTVRYANPGARIRDITKTLPSFRAPNITSGPGGA